MAKKKNKSLCVDSKVKMLYHLLILCTICSTRYVESVFVTAVIAAFGKITKKLSEDRQTKKDELFHFID